MKKRSYFYFLELFIPLQILTKKICDKDIPKTIIARSFTLGQLLEDYE